MDAPDLARSSTPSSEPPALSRPQSHASSRPELRRPPTIRLRRLPSSPAVRLDTLSSSPPQQDSHNDRQPTRRRSSSEPQRPTFVPADGRAGANNAMPSVPEQPYNSEATNFEPIQPARPQLGGSGRFRRASGAALSGLGLYRAGNHSTVSVPIESEYDSRIVDLLDVVDPEVSALSSLTNVQNSLFIPNLGRYINRMPTYDLSRRPPRIGEAGTPTGEDGSTAHIPPRAVRRKPAKTELRDEGLFPPRPTTGRTFSITSALSESRHAVLPHGISLEGWSEEDKTELDDHVRHMMHSRRSKFKRGLKGFGKYIRKPLGFLVTLYATLITLFGLAWVLFLIGWVYVGDRQYYVINVIDNVLVALFAIVGDGLAPFRVVDTYHMIFIAHYHHLTWSLRKKKALPELQNKNDLPTEPATEVDVESARIVEEELSVLTPKQQERLVHHQTKFSNSHTFYKPHETETHHAFPLRLLVAIVVLLDCHSLFQIALGACTWGINYHVRPQALTATILCCSITVNITAGILISVGDRRTRKKDVIERMFRQELTEEAIHKIEKKHEKHEERNEDDDADDGEEDESEKDNNARKGEAGEAGELVINRVESAR